MSKFGGKARSLIHLFELELPVPKFHVLSTLDFQDYRARGVIGADLRMRVLDVWKSWGCPPLAVRSSANCEDGEKSSFAGIFETYLGCASLDEILEAVQKCWDSAQSERVRFYCDKRGIDAASIEMAVILQIMIEPDYAGVLFTLDPTTGDESKMLLEVCAGRGENLVSGRVTPSRYKLPWAGEMRAECELPGVEVSDPVFTELREYARKIQCAKGKPQDIEFAVHDGRIFLLQARDITSIQFSAETGEWTTADFRDGGVSSTVVSPMMWELYERVFASSLPEFLRELGLVTATEARQTTWYKVFFGRPYWNLRAVKNAQAKLPGFVERGFDTDLSIPITYEGTGVTTGLTVSSIFRAVRALISMYRLFARQFRRCEVLLLDFPEIERHVFTPAPLAERLALLLDVQLRVESDYFRTIYNASNAKLDFSTALASAKKTDPQIEYIHLISDLGALRVTQSAADLRAIASQLGWEKEIQAAYELVDRGTPVQVADLPVSMQREFSQYLRKYGHHSERELDLRVPRWNEDLRFCLRTFAALAEDLQESAVEKRPSGYRQAFEKFKAAYRKGVVGFLLWPLARKKLARVRSFLWLREELRDRSTMVYGWFRSLMLEIAAAHPRIEGLSEKIFYLYASEVLAWLRGEIPDRELTRRMNERFQYAEGFRNFKNPNEIGARFVQRRANTVTAGALAGIGCSSGIIRAKARVVKSLAEIGSLKKGEILVAPFTDPGWTPVFGLASAVITETGGLLSHAALISREYGIPSVLNVAGATDVLKNGQEIEVDGTRGVVSIL